MKPSFPKPTSKQLRLLRQLAVERGETFATPVTRSQASAEIARLKTRPRSARSERAIERKEVARDLASTGNAAIVRDREVTGYGSTARWAERAQVQR
jgi:hypothetical protein